MEVKTSQARRGLLHPELQAHDDPISGDDLDGMITRVDPEGSEIFGFILKKDEG